MFSKNINVNEEHIERKLPKGTYTSTYVTIFYKSEINPETLEVFYPCLNEFKDFVVIEILRDKCFGVARIYYNNQWKECSNILEAQIEREKIFKKL